jgi:hypothetical protein
MGCVIMKTENPDAIIVISHDEYIDVYTKEGTEIIMNSLKECMRNIN